MTKLIDCPPVLSPRQLASFLQIGRTTTYALLRGGKIRCIKVGRQIRVPRSAVAEYLGQNEQED